MVKKRCIFFTFGFFFILNLGLIFNCSLAEAKWKIETIDTENNVGKYTSIAIDKNNYPHISYCDDAIEGNLKYAKWNGSSWDKEVIDTAKNTCLMHSSMVIDKKSRSHISYYEGPAVFSLKYAKYSKTSCNIEEIESLTRPGFGGISIALDGNNYPHISYVEGLTSGSISTFTANYKLKYTWWDGDSWEGKDIDSVNYTAASIPPDVGIANTSLALDTNYDAHISYYYNDASTMGLKYAFWNGSSWETNFVDSSGNVGKYSSLKLDSEGNSYVSYYDDSLGNLKYAQLIGSEWSKDAIDEVDDVGQYTLLELDSNNNPHISYYDATNKNLKYAHRVGSSWSVETVDSTGDVGQYSSLALDESDCPHISYYDADNGDLKYARWIPTYFIKGYVKDSEGLGIKDVTLALSGDALMDYTTRDAEYYEFLDLISGDYTITPTKSGWTFSPDTRSYSSLECNQENQDFVGTIIISTYSINGYVKDNFGKALSGVTLSLSGDATDSCLTDFNGYYEFLKLNAGSYTIIPNKSEWDFSPLKIDCSIVDTSKENQDFIGTYSPSEPSVDITYPISGYVKDNLGKAISGVTLNLSGDVSRNCTTNFSGYYEFIGLNAGNYTITPNKTKWDFNPSGRECLLVDASKENQDFTGIQIGDIDDGIGIHNYPNPCRKGQGTSFVYTLKEANDVQIDIYTDVGEFVRTVVNTYVIPGTYEIHWNGKDIHGHQMESGLYFSILKIGNKKAKRNPFVILP